MTHQLLQRQLKALGGGPRLAILTYLKKQQSANVSEVARAIDRSITTTSIHLSHLESLNIIVRRRRSREVYYRLSVPQDPVVRLVLKLL